MSELETLRQAARALEPARVVDALADVLEAWRVSGSLWRARLRREHPTFSPEVIELGTVRGLEGWTRDVLVRLREAELPERWLGPELTAVWLAGSIPTASFGSILLPLLAGSAVWVKPTKADLVSPRLFRDSLRAVDAELARAVVLGDGADVLTCADAVVVHGSDETLTELRGRVPPHVPFLGYGHTLSVAAVGAMAELEPAAEALGLDTALWDGRGCLSPAFAFVEDRPAGRAAAFAATLARVLERLETELPRGHLEPDEQMRLHELRSALAMREGVELWSSRGSLAWTVVLARFDRFPPVPGTLRSLPVVPVESDAALGDWLASFRPHLSCVGQAGFEDRLEWLAAAALRGGGSRLCPIGTMQLPPLDWHHDGASPIRPLLRTIDVETKGDRDP
jgi:hypothetical protein